MASTRVFILFWASFSSLTVTASNKEAINATIAYGYDTNPHQLSKSLNPIEQQFAIADLDFSERFFRLISVRARANKTLYFDDRRADEFNGYASLGLSSRFKIAKQKFKYKLSADYRSKDKTYVSKTTGLVATFAGQSIADRYDSTQLNYLGGLSYQPTSYLDFEISYQTRTKEYQTFEIDGLSNLDYTRQRYVLGMKYRPSKVGRFFLDGTIKKRDYKDRRGRELDRTFVPDTNLKYDYWSLDIGYIYRPSKKVFWKYTYNYEERRDNVSGYYNATSGFIAISARHQVGDYQFFTGRLKYLKFSLINQIVQNSDPLDDDNKDRQGGSAMIGYELVLATLFDTNLAFYVELEYRNFKNTRTTFSYERGVASAGVRWSAF